MFETTINQNNEQYIAELIAKTMDCEIIGQNIVYYEGDRVVGEIDAVLTNKNNEVVFLEIKEQKTWNGYAIAKGKQQLKKSVTFFSKKQNHDCAWSAQHAWLAFERKGNIHLLMREINDLAPLNSWNKMELMHHG
jgi:Holliday junction resolvase-like predicted endonuclease